jgi:hypothetical protein
MFDEVANQRLTEGSHFLWGNCMKNYKGTFLQGGSGYFMSRYTAGRLLEVSGKWLQRIWLPEDVQFRNLMRMAGLPPMYNATTEFMMGQYINHNTLDAMRSMSLEGIKRCPPVPPAAEGCRGFFARFNRLAVLHRLTATLKDFSGRPTPVYNYPDHLSWYQPGEISDVCWE